MKTFSRNQSIAAALLAAVTFGLPTAAQAQSYQQDRTYIECKKDDKDNQIIGGVIGAVAGGVLGSQVAGSGARTEGSVLGAALGAAAGAGIADDRRNCRTEAGYERPYSNRTYGSNTYYPSSRTTYPSTRTTYPTQTYRDGYYTTSHPVTRTYGHSSRNQHVRRHYSSLSQINWEIDRLRAERDRLKNQRHYRYDRYTEYRIEEIGQELRYLKNEKKRLKKRQDRYYY